MVENIHASPTNRESLKTWFIEWKLQKKNENINLLALKHIGASSTKYTFPPRIYEISDLDLTLKALLPNDVKIRNTIDDIRLWSTLTTKKKRETLLKKLFSIES